MPADYPDYPSHRQVLNYFESYVRHFNLNQYIQFNTTVLKVTRTDKQQWHVVFENEQGIHNELL